MKSEAVHETKIAGTPIPFNMGCHGNPLEFKAAVLTCVRHAFLRACRMSCLTIRLRVPNDTEELRPMLEADVQDGTLSPYNCMELYVRVRKLDQFHEFDTFNLAYSRGGAGAYNFQSLTPYCYT